MVKLLETSYRVQFNFSVVINDDETVSMQEKNEGLLSSTKREKRLLLALLRHNNSILTDFLKKSILIELESMDRVELEEKVFGRQVKEETLLAPVIESMEMEDANFFAHSLSQGVFAVQTEKFSQSFLVHLEEVTLTESPFVAVRAQEIKYT